MGNIKRTFDKAFKKQAVDLYLNGDMSYQSVADKLEIDKNQVRRWVKDFEDEGILGLEEKRGKAKGLGKGRPRTAQMVETLGISPIAPNLLIDYYPETQREHRMIYEAALRGDPAELRASVEIGKRI